MKTTSFSLLIGCLFALSAPSAKAQTNCSGVYLTPKDFLAGNLCSATTGRNKTTSTGDDLLSARHLFVNQAGMVREVARRDIYAIKCCDGNIVRIFHNDTYTLLNPGGKILLYKVVVYPFSKGDVLRVKYFFSRDAGSDVQDLTLDNVREAFRDNAAFGKAVEAAFRSDRELYAYDKVQKCYMLDRICAANQD
jgi:hypothetical protein